MNRNLTTLRAGYARRFLIGLTPACLLVFVACGGGGDKSAQLAQALGASCSGSSQPTQPGQAAPPPVQLIQTPVTENGKTRVEYSVPPGVTDPSCQTLAELQTLKSQFANLPADCGPVASNLNTQAMAQLSALNSAGANGTNLATFSTQLQMMAMQASQSTPECTQDLQNIVASFQTLAGPNGVLAANTQQGCQFFTSEIQGVASSIATALQGAGQTVPISSYIALANNYSQQSQQQGVSCPALQAVMSVLPGLVSVAQGNTSGGSFAPNSSFNLGSLANGNSISKGGSTVGSLASGTGTGTIGSTIGSLGNNAGTGFGTSTGSSIGSLGNGSLGNGSLGNGSLGNGSLGNSAGNGSLGNSAGTGTIGGTFGSGSAAGSYASLSNNGTSHGSALSGLFGQGSTAGTFGGAATTGTGTSNGTGALSGLFGNSGTATNAGAVRGAVMDNPVAAATTAANSKIETAASNFFDAVGADQAADNANNAAPQGRPHDSGLRRTARGATQPLKTTIDQGVVLLY